MLCYPGTVLFNIAEFELFIFLLPMDRNWTILDWNLRGINSQTRWNDIR
jgi:hypothetical protein